MVLEINFPAKLAAGIDAKGAGRGHRSGAIKSRKEKIVGAKEHATRLREGSDLKAQEIGRHLSRAGIRDLDVDLVLMGHQAGGYRDGDLRGGYERERA